MDDKAVREALDRLQCYGPPVDGYVGDVHTIRAHISAQAAMLAELREHCRQLSGDKFSDRNQAALKSRAETAERRCAELVALLAECFRLAGGDTDTSTDNMASRAVEVVRDLRQCYDESLQYVPITGDDRHAG